MLYIFYGSDKERARKRAKSFVNAFVKKRPNAQYTRIVEFENEGTEIYALSSEQGLFESKNIIMLDQTGIDLKPYLKKMQESQNAFIILEQDITKSLEKKVNALGGTVEEFTKREKSDKFNIFKVTDAIGSRNKDKIFVCIEECRREGVLAEEIIRPITWYVRSLLLAIDTNSAKEAGLNPFVFKKAKTASSSFDKTYLQKLLVGLEKDLADSRKQNAPELWNLLYLRLL